MISTMSELMNLAAWLTRHNGRIGRPYQPVVTVNVCSEGIHIVRDFSNESGTQYVVYCSLPDHCQRFRFVVAPWFVDELKDQCTVPVSAPRGAPESD